MSKGNPELLRFCFTSVPDWLIKSRHPLTNEIQKPTASWSLTFSRVLQFCFDRNQSKRVLSFYFFSAFGLSGLTRQYVVFQGDVIALVRKVDANWYEGRIGDRKGIVPSSYLDVFSEPEVKGMFVLEEAAHYVRFFCFKKLGQVTIHFRLNKIRLQDVWWKSDRTVDIVVREALTKIRQATYD